MLHGITQTYYEYRDYASYYFYNLSTKNKIKESVVAVDKAGLKSETNVKAKISDGEVTSTNRSVRVNYSYTDGKLNIILADNNGIKKIKITDQNSGKVIKTVSSSTLQNKLTNTTTNSDGTITKGVYSISLSKFTTNDDGKYYIKVDTTDGSGITGYDMAKFKIDEETTSSTSTNTTTNNTTANTSTSSNTTTNTSASTNTTSSTSTTTNTSTSTNTTSSTSTTTSSVPTSVSVNREVRIDVDKSNSNKLIFKLKDNAGIGSVEITAKSSGKTLGTYTVSNCNSNETLNDYITYKKYSSSDGYAQIVINKKYFTTNTSNNKVNFKIVAKDTSGLKCNETIYCTYSSSSGWTTNRGTRTDVSYKNGKVLLTLKDNDGIATGDAALTVTDENSGKTIVDLTRVGISSGLSSVEKNSSGTTIISGVYKIDISKFTMNSNNKYKIKIKATDSLGHSRVEVVELTASF